MCDVLFITPTNESKFFNESIGTLLLATIIKEKGIDTEILRFWQIGNGENYDEFLNNAISIILNKKPKIVSFYMRCDTDVVMLNMAKLIKDSWLKVYTVLGGPQSALTACNIIKEMDFIDFVCVGEGETTIYPFFSALLNGENYSQIPGLVWKDKGVIRQNPEPQLVENLDQNPMIDYSLIPFKYKQDTENIWMLDSIALDAGRGCPFECTFCSTKTFWHRHYRLKSNKRLIKEMLHAVEKTGCRHFALNHDLFTANRVRIISFCNEMIKKNIDVKWTCSSRVDTIDEELILLMKKAGLEKIFFGVESGSPRIQSLINKNLDVRKVVSLVKFLGKNGIFSTTSFIYGFPEENLKDIEMTLKLIIELLECPFNNVQTHLLTIETGTELFEKYQEQLVFSVKYSDVTEGIGRDENIDFICRNPKIFPHFLEYHSQLRDELVFVPHFIALFSRFYFTMFYIYYYFENMCAIEFYNNFVAANKQELIELEKQKKLAGLLKAPQSLIKKAMERYSEQKYISLVKEILRYETLKNQITMKDQSDVTKGITEVFDFDLFKIMQKGDMSDAVRKKSLLTISKKMESDLVTTKLLKYI